MTTQREPDTSAEGLRKALKYAREAIAKAPDDTWGSDTMGDADVPGGLMSWPVKDEILHNIDAALADAAGQAAPIPPPVQESDRNWLHRLLMHYAEAATEHGDDLGAKIYLTVEERDAIIAAHDRAEGLAKEAERLKADSAGKRYHEYRTYWEEQHLGKSFADVHARWWTGKSDVPYVVDQYEIVDAVVAALLQEGVTAWHGDATGIIAHMIRAQSDKRAEAEAKLRRLRGAGGGCGGGGADQATGHLHGRNTGPE